ANPVDTLREAWRQRRLARQAEQAAGAADRPAASLEAWRTLWRRRQLARDVEEATAGPAMPPATPVATWREVWRQWRLGRQAEAAREFQQALAIDRQNSDALLGLSRVAGQTADRASALTLAQAAANRRGSDPAALAELALAQAGAGKTGEAVRTFERALA